MRQAIDKMPEAVRPDLNRIVDEALVALSGGFGGSLTIPVTDIERIVAGAAPDVSGLTLGDGQISASVEIDLKDPILGIELGKTNVTVNVMPVVEGGRVGLDMGSLGKLAENMGMLDGLNRWIERLNSMVAESGHQVSDVGVSPDGIDVRFEPLP